MREPGMKLKTIRSRVVLGAVLLGAALVFAAVVPAAADSRLSPGLARLSAVEPERRVVAWVYFTDRPAVKQGPEAIEAARAYLSRRSLERRQRRSGTGPLVGDLPVHEPYLRALEAHGARVRGASRWLNAASVEIPARLAPEPSSNSSSRSYRRSSPGRRAGRFRPPPKIDPKPKRSPRMSEKSPKIVGSNP